MRTWTPFLVLMIVALSSVSATNEKKKVVCYFSSWAVYRPGAGKFDVEDLDPSLCTHAIYAFVGINSDGSVKVIDPWNDLEKKAFKRFNGLRAKNAELRTLVAVGGWQAGSEVFSAVAGDAALRATLVRNLFDFVRQHEFNGLDLDWEYPAQRGGAPEDLENFSLLVRELRAKFAPKNLLLSAAVSAAVAPQAAKSYNVSELTTQLDWVSLMTYDYHGHWEQRTGHNAPLYDADTDLDKNLNVDATVQYWLHQGAPASKLVLGIPFYGRSFTLSTTSSSRTRKNVGLGAPTVGAGKPGPYTREPGTLGYNEICDLMQRQSGWWRRWDAQQQVHHAVNGDQWVGLETAESVRIKASYAVEEQDLGGVMVWSVDTDDFRGECGDGAFPLLSKINAVVGSASPPK